MNNSVRDCSTQSARQMASAKRATFNEKHHLAWLSRGLHLALPLIAKHYLLYLYLCLYFAILFANKILDTLPILFERILRSYLFLQSTFTCEWSWLHRLLKSQFPFYFFSLTNPNNINFRVRSIVYIQYFKSQCD